MRALQAAVGIIPDLRATTRRPPPPGPKCPVGVTASRSTPRHPHPLRGGRLGTETPSVPGDGRSTIPGDGKRILDAGGSTVYCSAPESGQGLDAHEGLTATCLGTSADTNEKLKGKRMFTTIVDVTARELSLIHI